MTGGCLRDTFALLLREGRGQPAVLSADAERTIRRRVATRWAGRIGALAVIGALGAAAVAGTSSSKDGGDTALPSPIPTPTLGFTRATFPLTGGPEFAGASSELRCGDPAPAAHSADHGVELAVAVQEPAEVTSVDETRNFPLTATTFLSLTDTTDRGNLTTSGVDVLVVQDGIIRGVFQGHGATLGGNFAPSGGGDGQFPLIADWVRCPPLRTSAAAGLEPGSYELIAIVRVFSTPESVALSQAFGFGYQTWNLNPENLDDPNAIYLPGSYDCALLIDQMAPARACLPDITGDAVVDMETGTVTMFYKPDRLVEEFSTVLVSEPVTATLASAADVGFDFNSHWEGLPTFESLDSLACGASAKGVAVGQDAEYNIEALHEGVTLHAAQEAQVLPVTVFASNAPDGSTVELLPSGRLVWFTDSIIVSPDGNSSTTMSTVVGWAALTSEGSVTADRFVGPQATTYAMDPATICPGSEADNGRLGYYSVLVGQWRLTTPEGTVTTFDSATDPRSAYVHGG